MRRSNHARKYAESSRSYEMVDGLPAWYDSTLPKKILSKRRAADLVRQYRQGDEEAKYELALSCIRKLVVPYVNKKYSGQAGISKEDLVQEGMNGVVIAIENYDSSKSDNFCHYAFRYISSYVDRALEKTCKSRQIAGEEILSLDAILSRFPTQTISLPISPNGREFEIRIFADDSGEASKGIPQDNATLEEVMRCIDNEYAQYVVQRLLTTLPKKHRQVIEHHFGLGAEQKTLSEIGEEMGITRQAVQQIEGTALGTMRTNLHTIQ